MKKTPTAMRKEISTRARRARAAAMIFGALDKDHQDLTMRLMWRLVSRSKREALWLEVVRPLPRRLHLVSPFYPSGGAR